MTVLVDKASLVLMEDVYNVGRVVQPVSQGWFVLQDFANDCSVDKDLALEGVTTEQAVKICEYVTSQ